MFTIFPIFFFENKHKRNIHVPLSQTCSTVDAMWSSVTSIWTTSVHVMTLIPVSTVSTNSFTFEAVCMVFTFCIINLDDKFQISKNYMVIIKRLSKTLLLHCFSLLLFLKVIIVVVVVVIVAAEKLNYTFLTVSVCFCYCVCHQKHFF